MNRVFWILGLALAGVLSVFPADPKLRVLTTTLPGYSFAANVAGELAEVENLLPPHANPHDYQLSPGDMRKMAAAGLLVVNGLGIETFLAKAIGNIGGKAGFKIVTLSDGLEGRLIAEEGHAHHHPEPGHEHGLDPHFWLDPRLAAHAVTNLVKALQQADARNAEGYASNGRRYLERLERLDQELEAALAEIRPVPFVTYHNAFRYFVRRYGLRLAGVVEQTSEISPSPRELAGLLGTMRSSGAKALLADPGGSSRLAEQIARDAGVVLGELDPLETGDFRAESYEQGMRKNVENLRRALQR